MNHEMNDWKLTAYALGELDAAEQAAIEAEIRRSPELQREVEQIRATAGLLTREFQAASSVADDPGPIGLTEVQRQAIEAVVSSAWSENARDRGAARDASARPGLRRIRLPLALAASIGLCGMALYTFMPHLSSSRLPAKRLANAENIKGIGTSARVYANENSEKWPIPSYSQNVSRDYGEADPRASQRAFSPMPQTAMNGWYVSGSNQHAGQPYASPSADGAERMRFERDSAGGNPPGCTGVGEACRVNAFTVATAGPENTGGVSNDFTNYGGISYGFQAPFGPRSDAAGAIDNWYALSTEKGPFPADDLTRCIQFETAFSDQPWVGEPYRCVSLGLYPNLDPSSSERYNPIVENPFTLVEAQPLSTFSIDVDTAAYANIRRFLNSERLPLADAVRIEEMVNYFDYDYPPPAGEHPFSVNLEISECPWAPEHRLARIGIKGYELDPRERPAANLVFLIDVSGSMNTYDKLPLVQEALSLLIDQLDRRDSIGIVVYAGASGVVLPPTSGASKDVIRDAVDRLQAGGSTNGGAGIEAAYSLASQSFIEGGINRVILATDGDFNVGVTGQGELQRLIEEKKKSGVFLSVLGFGMGNLQDGTLETLADKGNGNYAYIDTIGEAQKVLVDQMGGTLFTIAKDVKIQVEFNPLEVAAYRLVGYENRMLAAQDFNDDTKDAGEIGAGHTVTALYEIIPAGQAVETTPVDALKYQTVTDVTEAAESGEMMTVKLRYKEPDGDTSKLIEVPVSDSGAGFAESSDDFAFAAAVASFGMLLRGSPHAATLDYAAVIEMAQSALGNDPSGYRAEFIELLQKTMQLEAPAGNAAPSP